MKGLVYLYNSTSDQVFNMHEKSLFFSAKTPRNIKTGLLEVINITNVGRVDKYLGLPFLVGRERVKVLPLYVKESRK